MTKTVDLKKGQIVWPPKIKIKPHIILCDINNIFLKLKIKCNYN